MPQVGAMNRSVELTVTPLREVKTDVEIVQRVQHAKRRLSRPNATAHTLSIDIDTSSGDRISDFSVIR
jgi:hypothetical protein